MTFSNEDRDRFALRYYEWSVGKLCDELATGFERVVNARVKSGAYVEAMARVAPSEKKATAMSRLKRLQPRGAELSGEPLSAREKTLIQRFDVLCTEVEAERNLKGFIGGTLFRARKGAAQIRRRLVKQLKHELPGALGEPEEDEANRHSLWSYRREVEGHLVRTICDATGSERHYDFEYSHRIPEKGGQPLVRSVNWLSWLGIHGHTQWIVSEEDEIPLVIAVVKSTAREFFEALPGMLPDVIGLPGE